jgi:hypothetical protein
VDLTERLSHVEAQLKTKNQELTKLRKKLQQIQADEESKEVPAPSTFNLAESFKPDAEIDERRFMILKTQNAKLTKSNAFL